MAPKAVICVFLLISSGHLYGEIPVKLRAHLIEEMTLHVKDPKNSYFSKVQKLFIQENYTDALINKFYKDIKLTPSFSRSELSVLVKKELRSIFDKSVTLPKPISLGKLKEQVEEIFLSVAYGKHPLGSSFEATPWRKANTYLIQVDYKTVALPILVTIGTLGDPIDDDSSISLQLYGLKNPFPNCLDASFFRSSNKLEIKWIRTQDVVCPIPPHGQGNFLLEFAEATARALKLTTISLSESSSLYCADDDKYIDLWLLKLFQQGKTWYESKGFSVKNGREDYEAKKSKLLRFKISDLESNLTNITNEINRSANKTSLNSCSSLNNSDVRIKQYCDFLKMKTVVEQYLQAYKQQTNGELLSGFMAWIYNQGCAKYYDILHFLFPYPSITPYKSPALDREKILFPLMNTYYKHL